MAHAALHFAIGMTAGLVLMAPRLRHAWKQRAQLYPAVKGSLLAAWGLGLAAIIPSLLKYAGVPESFCSGWWMNLFILHPLINQLLPQSLILASFTFGSLLTFQYLVILAAILRVPPRNRSSPQTRTGDQGHIRVSSQNPGRYR